MRTIDIFNGDADGLCALHQLRLAEPCPDALLVTGVKRDIDLLGRVGIGAGDRVTVLDISLDKNRAPLLAALAAGASVRYFDHHYAGEIPDDPRLEAHIDPAPEVCTSLLVDRHLGGRFRAWAVVGAFGDNLHASARDAAAVLGLDRARLAGLERLGTLLNYNGYGSSLDDLLFDPAELYRTLRPFTDPAGFLDHDACRRLDDGYRTDLGEAGALAPEWADATHALYLLPNTPWARRVNGVFGNALARAHPERAHAVLIALADGGFRVSVRAPLARRSGADALCRRFESGGGRAAAAGINRLPVGYFDRFVREFGAAFRA